MRSCSPTNSPPRRAPTLSRHASPHSGRISLDTNGRRKASPTRNFRPAAPPKGHRAQAPPKSGTFQSPVPGESDGLNPWLRKNEGFSNTNTFDEEPKDQIVFASKGPKQNAAQLEDGTSEQKAKLGINQAFDNAVHDLLEFNPDATLERLLLDAHLAPDGRILSWSLHFRRLQCLPGSFGCLRIEGDLDLSCNVLASLPPNFIDLSIGGTLNLNYNRLSQLPMDIDKLNVAGDLCCSHNYIVHLPKTIAELRVGGNLVLANNAILSVEPLFEAHVGGNLDVSHNHVRIRGHEDFKNVKGKAILHPQATREGVK